MTKVDLNISSCQEIVSIIGQLLTGCPAGKLCAVPASRTPPSAALLIQTRRGTINLAVRRCTTSFR